MMRSFNIGVVVGGFQLLHNGHVNLISQALMACNQVVVYLKDGDLPPSYSEDKPFPSYVRKRWIEKIFAGNIGNHSLLIRDLKDTNGRVGKDLKDIILNEFRKEFNCDPSIYVCGEESPRAKWFTTNDLPNTHRLIISKKQFDIQTQDCRELLEVGDVDELKKVIPAQIYDEIPQMKFYMDKVTK